MYELIRKSFWEKTYSGSFYIGPFAPSPSRPGGVFVFAVNNFFRDQHFEKWSGALSKSRAVCLREGWEEKVNYNMDPSCFPLHTAQVTLTMCITLPSFGAVNAQRRLACVAGAIGTVYILTRSVSLGQNVRGICCE